eukprot:scaffold65954_cov47-Prasinocladus_malaysianus.AAC.5
MTNAALELKAGRHTYITEAVYRICQLRSSRPSMCNRLTVGQPSCPGRVDHTQPLRQELVSDNNNNDEFIIMIYYELRTILKNAGNILRPPPLEVLQYSYGYEYSYEYWEEARSSSQDELRSMRRNGPMISVAIRLAASGCLLPCVSEWCQVVN